MERISAIPVTLDGDRWNPFMVSTDHPAFTAFRKLRYSSLIRDYEDEKSARDEFNQKNGIDVFVASYTVYENKKENTLRSFGVWSEGVPTLLPVTDAVGFDPEGEPSNPGDLLGHSSSASPLRPE